MLELAWVSSLPVTKIGILLFYWRIFTTRRFRMQAYAVGAFVVLCFLCAIFPFLFQCIPIESFWEHGIPHRCLNRNAFYIATGILNLVSDITILTLPISAVAGLKMSRRGKIGISIFFLLGGL